MSAPSWRVALLHHCPFSLPLFLFCFTRALSPHASHNTRARFMAPTSQPLPRRGIIVGTFLAGVAAMCLYMRFRLGKAAPVVIHGSDEALSRHPVLPAPSPFAMPPDNSSNPLHSTASSLADPRSAILLRNFQGYKVR